MNLMKNVDGSWDQAKDKLRKDLDTIQRNLNNVVSQINAPTVAASVPPANITAANTPTTFSGKYLQSVALVPNSGLYGNGTLTNPLGFLGSGALVTTGFTLSITQMQTLNSIPAILAPGIPNQVLQFISVAFHSAQTTQFSSNVSGTIRYDTLTTDYSAPLTVVMGGLTPGVQVDFWSWTLLNVGGGGTPVVQISTPGNPTQMGKGIVLHGSTDSGIGPVQAGRTQITGAVTYYAV